VSGQDRKFPPAPGTNQIAGFREFRPLTSQEKNKYMLFAGWEVRIVKNCDRGLEHFQVRGHSSSLYGPTLSR